MKAEFDFIIIGSGVLGCLAYDYFASQNDKALLISESNDNFIKNEFIQTGSEIYSGLIKGTRKGLGGTSQLWGGAMNVSYEKEFIEQCSTESINFEIEKKRVFKLFGIRNLKSQSKKKIYSSKKYDIYEEDIIWPSFSKRNVFKNLKQKYKNHLNLKIGFYKKIEKIDNIFRVLVRTEAGKIDIFTAQKVVFCMGFFNNISEHLQNKENYKFKEHISSKIGTISNTKNFPLSSCLLYKFNHFKTKRYEIFDNRQNKSVGFMHMSTNKSDFLIKLRELLICLQSFKFPSGKLIYDVIKLSYQIFLIIKGLILQGGNISSEKNKSYIHLVIDKPIPSNITKFSNNIKLDWNISRYDLEFYNSLKDEMCQIIQILIDKSTLPKKSLKVSETSRPVEIFHPFSNSRKKSFENSDYIWTSTSNLQQLGSLSPTIASHLLKIKEYENARKNMCNNINKK
ncbi:MAG: hypothetical protein CL851_04055 [Crocinitomicaceae bacterium]|nr:hypothetical protein [Crocinitomicaceae bacterium]